MNIIVAVDECWGIGKDNDLLFHVPEDMKFFRSMTLGKNVVCGKNTLLSFPAYFLQSTLISTVISSAVSGSFGTSGCFPYQFSPFAFICVG